MNDPERPTNQPTFLLGAGFNFDAKSQAGPIYFPDEFGGERKIECSYPLAAQLVKVCFGLESPPSGKTVEDLFLQAERDSNLEPVKRLTDCLFEADTWLGSALARSRESGRNAYKDFFQRFQGTTFLTYNYDSLPEILLLELGAWNPADGYGVRVHVAPRAAIGSQGPPGSPSTIVCHLHGSLCISTSVSLLEKTREPGTLRFNPSGARRPRYLFDPHSSGVAFPGYRRVGPEPRSERPEQRLIAPVPDKTKGLKRQFVQEMYRRATEEISTSSRQLVVIGYSFNPHDKSSYQPILSSASSAGKEVLLVSPDAQEIRSRLRTEYPAISVSAAPLGFSTWCEHGYPGLLE